MNWTYYGTFPLMWYDLVLPCFLNELKNGFLELSFSLFDQFGQDLIMSSCFSFFQLTNFHLCVYTI